MRHIHKDFTVTRHLKDNKSKATNSLFLVKMIVNLERIQNNEDLKKDQHRNPANSWRYIKQQNNNNYRTTALERTAA